MNEALAGNVICRTADINRVEPISKSVMGSGTVITERQAKHD